MASTPATAPEYPDRGESRIAFARRNKVIVLDVAAGANAEIDFSRGTVTGLAAVSDVVRGMLGRWVDVTVTGDEMGYFFMSRAQADEAPAVQPDLTARAGTNPAQQCGRFADGDTRRRFLSKHFPVLRVVAGATDIVIRIEESEV